MQYSGSNILPHAPFLSYIRMSFPRFIICILNNIESIMQWHKSLVIKVCRTDCHAACQVDCHVDGSRRLSLPCRLSCRLSRRLFPLSVLWDLAPKQHWHFGLVKQRLSLFQLNLLNINVAIVGVCESVAGSLQNPEIARIWNSPPPCLEASGLALLVARVASYQWWWQFCQWATVGMWDDFESWHGTRTVKISQQQSLKLPWKSLANPDKPRK